MSEKQEHEQKGKLHEWFGNGNRPITIQTLIQLGIVVGTVCGGWQYLDHRFSELQDAQSESWRLQDEVRWQQKFEERNPELKVPSAFETWQRSRFRMDQIDGEPGG